MQICPYHNNTFKPLFSLKPTNFRKSSNACKSAHITTTHSNPFFSLKPTNFRKSSKVVQTQSWLLVATLGKSFPILASMWHTIHQCKSSEQSKHNVHNAFASMWHIIHHASSKQSKAQQRQCHKRKFFLTFLFFYVWELNSWCLVS
jgi:hypothetical protein